MKRKNLKKIDLAANLSEKLGFSNNYSKKLIDDLILIISENIRSGKFTLKNIGTFLIKKKKERIGRNPKTGIQYRISARNSISFISSKNLKL